MSNVWGNQSNLIIRILIYLVLHLTNHVLIPEIIKLKQMCICYCTPLHAHLVLCQMLLYTCTAPRLNLPVSLNTFPFLFVVVCLSPSFYQNKWGCIKHCWCPVCWTNYGHLCSFYGNLCQIILWSFLGVVQNLQQNGAYVAVAQCLYLHGVHSPICMCTVILSVLFWL